jgi:chloramphenicol O-acetyltransferase type A
MPLAVQAHHALMDGLHVGRYYTVVQELLDRPEFLGNTPIEINEES